MHLQGGAAARRVFASYTLICYISAALSLAESHFTHCPISSLASCAGAARGPSGGSLAPTGFGLDSGSRLHWTKSRTRPSDTTLTLHLRGGESEEVAGSEGAAEVEKGPTSIYEELKTKRYE